MVNMNCNLDIANLWRECENHRQSISNARRSFQELKDERKKLEAKKAAIDRRISSEEDRGFNPTETVKGWIERVDVLQNDLLQILAEDEYALTPPDECCGGFCYVDDISAYNQGTKIVHDMLPRVKALVEEKLIDAEMFTRAPVDHLPVDKIIGMDGIVNEIWDCIGAHDPRVIRICGMAGVGKTALMKTIHNKFQEKRFGFTRVVWVDASKSSYIPSVQLSIADKLGLTFPEDATPESRARSINVALKKEKFVLFINDPHKDLTLTDVGIPTHHDNQNNRYKVVFDTRDEAVSLGLGGDLYRSIKVDRLTSEDAWNLFEMSVGQPTLNSHSGIPAHAKTVAKICDGLPLTLVTLGLAMQSKTTVEDWVHAIQMLQKHAPRFEAMADKVYKVFLISYEGLEQTAQQCFLYCSLFPRECFIEDEELLDYWLGENFLTEFPELDGIRYQGHTIINALSKLHLLEKGRDDKIVKMHDTIRGSALWMAGGCEKHENVYWVRSGQMLDEFPGADLIHLEDVERISLVRCKVEKLNKPRSNNLSMLSTLILKGSIFKEISRGFFQPMVSLKVLDLSSTNIDKFPQDIPQLTSLQYLNLSYTFISELPKTFKKLTKLKLLNLSHIGALEKISLGVIGRLANLQVLNMYQCGFEHNHVINNGIVLSGSDEDLAEELKGLRNLQDLRITVTSDVALQSFRSSTKLHCIHSLFITKYEGSTSLQLPPVQNLDNLKVFHVVNCSNLEDIRICWEMIDETAQRYRRQGSEISRGRSFGNLAHVEIDRCWKLKNLTWLIYAPTLQSVRVRKCMTMTEVIDDIGSSSSSGSGGHGDSSHGHLFTALKSIHLSDLPELKLIYHNALPFGFLEEITVLSCPKLSKLPLDANSAKTTLRSIRGHQKWWDNLRWKEEDADRAIETTYLKYFHPSER